MDLVVKMRTYEGHITDKDCSLYMSEHYGIGVSLKDSDKSKYEPLIASLDCQYYNFNRQDYEVMQNLFGDDIPSVLIRLHTTYDRDICKKEYCVDGLILLLNNLLKLIPQSLLLVCDEDEYCDFESAMRFGLHICIEDDYDYKLIKSVRDKLNNQYVFNNENKTLSILFLKEID